jgi:hypothetical protein
MRLHDCIAVVRLEPDTGADAQSEVLADLTDYPQYPVHTVVWRSTRHSHSYLSLCQNVPHKPSHLIRMIDRLACDRV